MSEKISRHERPGASLLDSIRWMLENTSFYIIIYDDLDGGHCRLYDRLGDDANEDEDELIGHFNTDGLIKYIDDLKIKRNQRNGKQAKTNQW